MSNLNDGGLDNGVGDVLGRECRHQKNTALCGDTNNWDMVLNYSPYHTVTQAKFNGSAERWAADAAARLQGWHFNTISGYSSAVAEQAVGSIGMYYNRLLMFATNFAMPGGTLLQQSTAGGCFCHDVFSDEFVNASDAYATANVLPRANDTALLGRSKPPHPPWWHPRICSRTLMGYSGPPISVLSGGAAPCYLLVMLTRAALMASLFQRLAF